MKLVTFAGILFLLLGLAFGASMVSDDVRALMPKTSGKGDKSGISAVFFSALGVGCILWGWASAASEANAERLRTAGLPGRATIVDFRDTGVTLNKNPVVELTLQMQVQGRLPYEVKAREQVPRLVVSRLVRGGSLPVKVDPAAPEVFLIDWDAP